MQGFLNIYFHPWEFTDISNPKYKLPNFTFKNTNEAMINRFDDFIKWAKRNNYQFFTIKDFLENWTQKKIRINEDCLRCQTFFS